MDTGIAEHRSPQYATIRGTGLPIAITHLALIHTSSFAPSPYLRPPLHLLSSPIRSPRHRTAADGHR
eukprot:15031320-Alexandrium_andersonii.AAC.1